jgi:hypothetical protein
MNRKRLKRMLREVQDFGPQITLKSDHSNNRSSIRFCWCIFPELCSRRT